ncbi:hypothetical protein CORC01_10662 [Colletotrichum orchidophilum]|uniref:BTB domain transcription factor n=1 Tax=Colletotrichum orchidophilum TaxID=1209926 RepID=A0A1G4AY72_9PEZI|nr:uncharacterized protein CORC01_10662 [Colletotrichum orchidophilum]OHE94087.1 hypothetical protein CORC01_10662 [Colletotrichum orchidophilum]
MVTTRTRSRANSAADANGQADSSTTAGEKRGIEKDGANGSPDAKRAKKSDDAPVRQTTIDEAFSKEDDTEVEEAKQKAEAKQVPADTDMKDGEEEEAPNDLTEPNEPSKEEEAAMTEKIEEVEKAEQEQNKTQEPAATTTTKVKPEAGAAADGETAEKTGEKDKVPSTILEKGIIYFFFRARVNTDQAEEVDDIARSYMILRPIATDSALGDGPIGDAGNTRLLALPKKVFPETGRDKFMVFVEKAGASFAELKEQFLSGADNQTKAGVSHAPAATPAGEGVYIITTTGRDSHLAYMLTLPSDLGEVQKELGLKEKGSFILSTKNPYKKGPANASLDQTPDFPDRYVMRDQQDSFIGMGNEKIANCVVFSIKDDFRDLRWTNTKPEHLDYPNAQFLLIGESSGIKNAVEPKSKDVKAGKEDPEDVLQEIEDEDAKRMEHLSGDDSASIFADLQARAKDYPKLQTTF